MHDIRLRHLHKEVTGIRLLRSRSEGRKVAMTSLELDNCLKLVFFPSGKTVGGSDGIHLSNGFWQLLG